MPKLASVPFMDKKFILRKVEEHMNETRIYADAFETTFANPKEMLDFLAERAKAATWIRKPTRSLRLVPIS